jgi:hypothetical protein
MNFDVRHDSIDLSCFTDVQSLQQLSSTIIANAAGEKVIDLGDHHCITLSP